MVEIIKKEVIAPEVKLFEVDAPLVAEKALPGQFVVIRLTETGERIPLTIADTDKKNITLVVQEVGKTTKEMGMMSEGDTIADCIGPLGRPSEIKNFGTCICIGGGAGIAPIYPIARALKKFGNTVISIIGARSKELLFFENRMKKVSDEFYITTDDGSYGRKGFVSDQLLDIIKRGTTINRVIAIGPTIMMKVVCGVTKPYNIKTIVSLDPIMVDGTGMCGACRVEVGGETKFACVDGPEFDGHLVNFDLLMKRQRMYLKEEKEAIEKFCM
jgi:ferredoxin--NADP+ reductase